MKEQHKIKEPEKLSPLCRGDCKLCNSNFAELVHSKIADGETYNEISNYLRIEKKFEISSSSIGRHYNNVKEYKRLTLEKKLITDIDKETDELVGHQKTAIIFANLIRDRLVSQFTAGMRVEISDWEKIIKLYHQVLLGKGEGDGGRELRVVFEQMQDKYGARRQQMALKFGGDEAPAEQKKENGKEEH